MLSYTYDITNGKLLGWDEVFIDPLTNEPKLPAHSTDVAPPPIPEDHEAFFDFELRIWTIKKIPTELEEILAGDKPIPAGKKIVNDALVDKTFADILAEMEMTDDHRKLLCSIADNQLGYLLDQGFNYNGVHYQANQGFQSNMTAFLTAINAGFPGPVLVRTKENTETSFTKDEFPPFAFALMAQVQAVYRQIWDSKDFIRSAANAIDCLSTLNNLGIS
jgi:hypothetical protein